MKALKFVKTAAQGEILITRISKDKVPAGLTEMKPEGGHFIIGHSETGHHHVITAERGTKVFVSDKAPEGMTMLYAILENPGSLDHLRDHDTHQPIALEAGAYEFRTAREYDPFSELARRSID